jgi:hypothetical protein
VSERAHVRVCVCVFFESFVLRPKEFSLLFSLLFVSFQLKEESLCVCVCSRALFFFFFFEIFYEIFSFETKERCSFSSSSSSSSSREVEIVHLFVGL